MTYHRPTDLSDALACLGPGMIVAAGCTDLFPATEAPELRGDILDITAIDALRGIVRTERGFRIGAATRWSEVIAADLPPACNGLKAAAREVGSVQIQNAATVAGNLCNASPAADGVPPLLTLGAEVEIRRAGETRVLPLEDFLLGPRRTALEPGELVTAIELTTCAGGSGFHKLGARRYLVISIVMSAARVVVDGGRIVDVALAVGAASPVARRLRELERQITGRALGEAADIIAAADLPLAPIDDVRADAAYRRDAARQALIAALEGAG